jgi:hypothetical protein
MMAGEERLPELRKYVEKVLRPGEVLLGYYWTYKFAGDFLFICTESRLLRLTEDQIGWQDTGYSYNELDETVVYRHEPEGFLKGPASTAILVRSTTSRPDLRILLDSHSWRGEDFSKTLRKALAAYYAAKPKPPSHPPPLEVERRRDLAAKLAELYNLRLIDALTQEEYEQAKRKALNE